MSIEEKKRAVVAPFVKQIDICLKEGIPALRFWCAAEADECEKDLIACRTIFTDLKSDGKTMKDAAQLLEKTSSFMMFVWAQCFCGFRGWECNMSDVSKPEPTNTKISETAVSEPPKITVEIQNAPWITKENQESKVRDDENFLTPGHHTGISTLDPNNTVVTYH